jgi:transposase
MVRTKFLARPPSPMLAHESVYVGIDVGKRQHVAGFVSTTLLQRHGRFEGCPVLAFANSREGFRSLVGRLEAYTALEQIYVLLEKTGHYHFPLLQYLLDLDLSVYLIHVQTRPKSMLKSDKRDALSLANHLYTQLELGAQVAEKRQLVRRAIPPTEAAVLLRGLVRHRYELTRETTQRKNKLTAVADQLFPEFVQVFKDPNAPPALAYREQFPTPGALAAAPLESLEALRSTGHPLVKQLVQLQGLALETIGVKDRYRQQTLVLEQEQLIRELHLLQEHIARLDQEIVTVVERSREGRILTSVPGVGPIQAATVIAATGHIDNFASAAALKAYFGWAPEERQSGDTLDKVKQTRAGTRTMKQMMFLIVCNAIKRPECEWARLYARLLPKKCRFDERTQRFKGRGVVMGRIAGQIIGTIYALLKRDAELLARLPPGAPAPAPTLYDPALHRAHIEGNYRPLEATDYPTNDHRVAQATAMSLPRALVPSPPLSQLASPRRLSFCQAFSLCGVGLGRQREKAGVRRPRNLPLAATPLQRPWRAAGMPRAGERRVRNQ